MQKYQYIYLGHGISEKAEKEYNHLCRYELYQWERDWVHGLVYYDENFYFQIVDETTLPQHKELSRREKIWKERLELLPYAVEWLKYESPEGYVLIQEYYFSGKKIKLKHLAKKYGVSHQTMSRRIAQAREILKNFIISHEHIY